jgi:hypothetical protein
MNTANSPNSSYVNVIQITKFIQMWPREVAMPIRTYISGRAFDPEALAVLNAAFEGICADLGVKENAHHSREIVAKKVLELSDGQRDPKLLRAAVLASLANNTPPS